MEIATKYAPESVEGKWYEYWIKHQLFASRPDGREAYTVVIPPPNVTGVLHMGHMLNNTIQDILVRRARMEGKNACWVPGTDHASIATEAKVVAKLAQQGIKKTDLSREEFLKHAWDWTEEHGGIILKQLRRLGASCDWNRTAFTMDEQRSESVLKVFVDLYKKGLIYRGLRMVNWDPKAQTALSNEEVIYREEKSKLYYLKYYVADDNGQSTGEEGEIIRQDERGRYALVATTRPETIMGDTAMCINPKDPKNAWLKGQKVIVPLVGRVIPVIEDRYVDAAFGTGCLKVTPAHDVNDYNLGKTHQLETIDIFNPNGTIAPAAGMYVGLDRMEVRKLIAQDLEKAGLLEKSEDYDNKVGYSERNADTAVEPRLCMQWYLSMQHFADLALPPVMNDELRFYPSKYKNTYSNWLSNIQDWCISRQLWWGHRIPAYYISEPNAEVEEFFVALTPEEALAEARAKTGRDLQLSDLRQDDAALDTWFSSWLWPISLFDGINNPQNDELAYYYPTADLVTGPDIIFFWVARMIMAGYEYTGNMPFRNVYFTGIVRDKQGRKMSKSLGNSPDPLDLIDKFGADGVRMGMMLSAPAGNDILFDEALCEQGRNFCNKIWNAFRLVQGWTVSQEAEQPATAQQATAWFAAQLRKSAAEVSDLFAKYRLSEALMEIYRLFWDEFSSWYLEMVKPAFGQAIDQATYEATVAFFNDLLHLLHPFMPFITEELWQHIAERKEGESIMVSPQDIAPVCATDAACLQAVETLKAVVQNVRSARAQKNISPKQGLTLSVVGENEIATYDALLQKMANIDQVQVIADTAALTNGYSTFMVGTRQYALYLGELVDLEAEKNAARAELEHLYRFLKSIQAKLANERFVSSAPEAVVAMERKKESDTLAKIATLEAKL